MAKDNSLEVGVCVCFLFPVGILSLQWSESNGFVLKGMGNKDSLWIFICTPKYKQHVEGSGRRGQHSDLYNLWPLCIVFGCTTTDPHPNFWLCAVKALHTDKHIHAAAEFCNKIG